MRVAAILLLLVTGTVNAHSGGTNAEGCHASSQPYHCHGGSTKAATDKRPSNSYIRSDYGSWADTDGDCKSTRHEVLEQMNVGQLQYSPNGCRVVSGRWFGVFSGKYFYDAKKVDIDHVFPIALADRLGARAWPKSRKRQFFNDPANILPVSASLNRSKGAKDPTQWLPPNTQYRCEYVTRFLRVGLKYGLVDDDYRTQIDRLRAAVCG